VLELLSPELAGQPQLRKVAGQAWWGWIAEKGKEVACIEWVGQHAEAAAQISGWKIAGLNATSEDWTPDRVDRVLAALQNVAPSGSFDRFTQLLIAQLSSFQPKIASPRPPGSRRIVGSD